MQKHPTEQPFAGPNPRPAVGRFAPSPTGELHLGSLTTAIASYCHIKSLNGRWLLRIEDTDYQRCTRQYSDNILYELEKLGLYWDLGVVYQSQRNELYNDMLSNQLDKRIYDCTCSRKQLQGHDIYPRFCLPKPINEYSRHSTHPKAVTADLKPSLEPSKVRVQLPNHSIGFLDHLQGMQWVNPQRTLGDVVLRRADGIINYFLAVSVDDGLQGVTHVMRGLDILPLTTAQIALMSYLDLPAVERWYHLPLVKNSQGQKLSKQNLASPIDTSSIEKCQKLIQLALTLLKQPKVEISAPRDMLTQATAQWQNDPLKNQTSLGKI